MSGTMVNQELKQDPAKARLSSSIAMIMALISFSMLFATLMLGYFAFRFTSEVWPPLGMERISLGIPTASTVVILLSSLLYLCFESKVSQKSLKSGRFYFTATFVLGCTFMIIQTLLWSKLKELGIFTGTSVFASMLYAFTWIHAAHVAGGIIALLFLIPTVSGTREHEASLSWVQNVGQYWHFLGIVWVIMYFSLFVF
jgi:cytochrome c oxidase subunit 3